MVNPDINTYRRGFMRLLSIEERKCIWKNLKNIWGILPYNYWYPLTDQDFDIQTAIALDAELFEKEFGYEKLRGILKDKGINKVIYLSENGYGEKDSEVELTDFEPEYCGAEGFWCTSSIDWVIYASHEVSITFAGEWLVEEIKKNYPFWNNRSWFDIEFK